MFARRSRTEPVPSRSLYHGRSRVRFELALRHPCASKRLDRTARLDCRLPVLVQGKVTVDRPGFDRPRRTDRERSDNARRPDRAACREAGHRRRWAGGGHRGAGEPDCRLVQRTRTGRSACGSPCGPLVFRRRRSAVHGWTHRRRRSRTRTRGRRRAQLQAGPDDRGRGALPRVAATCARRHWHRVRRASIPSFTARSPSSRSSSSTPTTPPAAPVSWSRPRSPAGWNIPESCRSTDSGTSDQGRPFYAMRFVRGQSLKEAIDAYHQKHSQHRTDPPAEPWLSASS